MNRRKFIGGTIAATAAIALPGVRLAAAQSIAQSATASRYFKGSTTDGGFTYRNTNFEAIDPKWKRQMVKYFSDEPQGTVVIDTNNNYMYWIWENNTAIRYGVGVGREGFQWFGRANVARKQRWPTWTPPKEMHERQPGLPQMMEGGPDNPMGARGLYLHNDKGDTGYRLHGTAEPWSIGSDVSSGCIRMFNEDVIDLYRRVPIGTSVLVLEHISDRG